MHNVVWGCAENFTSHSADFTFKTKKKLVRHLNIIFAPRGREFECANYQKFLSLGGGVAPGCAGC